MTCDDFQIAIERRLHGDLGEVEAAPLDRHLSSCEACQGYLARAREVEAKMSATADAILKEVDWERVREGMLRYRRRALASVSAVAVFLGALYLVSVLLPMRPVSRAEMALRNLPIIGGGFAVYALGTAAWLRYLARLTDPIEMLAFYRNRARLEARWSRRAQWGYAVGLAVLAAVNLLRPSPTRLPGSLAMAGLVAALWAYDRFVRIPRIEREWADLEPRP